MASHVHPSSSKYHFKIRLLPPRKHVIPPSPRAVGQETNHCLSFSFRGYATPVCEIWSFHGGEDDDIVVLWFWRPVDSSVDSSVLEKHTVSLQPWRWRQYVSPKRWHLPTSLHGSKTQKNINNSGLFHLRSNWRWTFSIYVRASCVGDQLTVKSLPTRDNEVKHPKTFMFKAGFEYAIQRESSYRHRTLFILGANRKKTSGGRNPTPTTIYSVWHTQYKTPPTSQRTSFLRGALSFVNEICQPPYG
jgi:hypothetical protein